MINPIKGAKKIKAITINTPEGKFPSVPGLYQFTTLKPECAMAAPAKPPIKVCEDEEGIPFHQVIKFQTIAANTPDNITVKLMFSVLAVFATVSATPNPNTQKARKLKNAAHSTA